MRQSLLTNSTRLMVLTTPDKEEDVLLGADTASLMDLSEESNRGMEVLNKAMNAALYIYNADFSDLEELYEFGTGEELAAPVDFLLCDAPYNVRVKREL